MNFGNISADDQINSNYLHQVQGEDYSAEYLNNGMSFLISSDTKTERYVFGIAWINDVGWDEPIEKNNYRENETWFGADPTLSL